MQILIYSELRNRSIDIPRYFPGKGKLIKDVRLGGYYWGWNENKIHIDHQTNENALKKIIMLHILEGTGRLYSFIMKLSITSSII